MKATKAVFRRFADGVIIALFYEDKNDLGEVTAYMGGAFFAIAYKRVISITRPATRKQYKNVFAELQGLGMGQIEVYMRARPGS